MSSPIIASSFDVKKLTVSEIKKLDNGSSQVYMNYSSGRVRVQAPRMRVPYNAGDYQGNQKFKIQFSFGGMEENSRLKAFYNMIEAIDNFVIDTAVKNAGKWFKKPGASREMIAEFYTPSLKFSKDKEGNIRSEYPPTLSAALKQKNGGWDVELYDDANRHMADVNPCDVMLRNAEVIPILDATGIWVADKKFGLTWKLHQGRIMRLGEGHNMGFVGLDDEADGVTPSPSSLVGGGSALGGAGISEEEELDVLAAVSPAPTPVAAPAPAPVPAPVPAPAPVPVSAVADEDEDDDLDNILPTPSVPAVKAPAPKAVVKAKPSATATSAPVTKKVVTKVVSKV